MKKITIKIKLILLFITIKLLPLLVIVYISYEGIKSLSTHMNKSSKYISNQSKEIILNTANATVENSIKSLDKKSQNSLERLSLEIANNIAEFLKQRDNDILFLSKVDINDELLENFFYSKKKDILVSILDNSKEKDINIDIKQFNYNKPTILKNKSIPIYKEITFFDLNGKELNKVSLINPKKLDISVKKNTYINSETYFKKIHNLKENEIYVSDMIGEYVGTKIIGAFTKEKAKELNIPYKPQDYGYAPKNNPLGKKFEGIIRFITPVYKNESKIGYLSLALNHKHIMEFTDHLNPISKLHKTNDISVKDGNYAFLFDSKTRVVSHIEDYLITGFDKETGQRVPPWISEDLQKEFEKSKYKDLNKFIENYPVFDNPSINKKPNLKQLNTDGKIPIDCRYLNFTENCYAWNEITKEGGNGSFLIFWNGAWKLVTASSIPYFTGQYKNTKRGFGFIALSIDSVESYDASTKTRKEIKSIIDVQNSLLSELTTDTKSEIDSFIFDIGNKLILIAFIMIVVIILFALFLSNYISSKINNLLIGTKKFSKNEFDYKIKVTSNDEIGNLENSFNKMSSKINKLIIKQNELNEELEAKVEDKTKELKMINHTLEDKVKEEVYKNRQKDAQLVQHSKMASLGEMISMIIHQWKQPLTAISMVCSSQKLRIALNEVNIKELEKDNEVIDKQIELMSSTMDDFRNFFKVTSKEEYGIDSVIKKSINLIEKIYKYQGIFINYKTKAENISTIGYENETIQVIINILNNSRDAICENNSIYKNLDIDFIFDEDNIFISIQDYAGGIPTSIMDNIFKAYFTTKDENKGTGLGLYMCKTILDKVQGEISVKNKELEIDGTLYKGANFIIKLKRKQNG